MSSESADRGPTEAAEDLSGFDGGEVVPLAPPPAGTRNVTISVRLSPAELQLLGERAEAAEMKLTTYIRTAALRADGAPVDDTLIERASEVVDLVAALRASVEAARASRERASGPGAAAAG